MEKDREGHHKEMGHKVVHKVRHQLEHRKVMEQQGHHNRMERQGHHMEKATDKDLEQRLLLECKRLDRKHYRLERIELVVDEVNRVCLPRAYRRQMGSVGFHHEQSHP